MFFSLESDQKYAKKEQKKMSHSEMLLQHVDKLNNEKVIIVKYKVVIQNEKYDFQNLLQGATTSVNEFTKNTDKR